MKRKAIVFCALYIVALFVAAWGVTSVNKPVEPEAVYFHFVDPRTGETCRIVAPSGQPNGRELNAVFAGCINIEKPLN